MAKATKPGNTGNTNAGAEKATPAPQTGPAAASSGDQQGPAKGNENDQEQGKTIDLQARHDQLTALGFVKADGSDEYQFGPEDTESLDYHSVTVEQLNTETEEEWKETIEEATSEVARINKLEDDRRDHEKKIQGRRDQLTALGYAERESGDAMVFGDNDASHGVYIAAIESQSDEDWADTLANAETKAKEIKQLQADNDDEEKKTLLAQEEQAKLEKKYGKGFVRAQRGKGENKIFPRKVWDELGENKAGWKQVVETPDEVKQLQRRQSK